MMLRQTATVIVTVTVILCILATVAVALRLYCRRLQKLPLGGDDYCVLITLVRQQSLAFTIFMAHVILGPVNRF